MREGLLTLPAAPRYHFAAFSMAAWSAAVAAPRLWLMQGATTGPNSDVSEPTVVFGVLRSVTKSMFCAKSAGATYRKSHIVTR